MNILRVATYNIHKGVQGVGPRRRLEIHNLGHAVEQLDADIVCLQEVRKLHRREELHFTHWPDLPQADFLAPEGYAVVYRTNAITRHGEHGNALLSRWPVLTHQQEDISDQRSRRAHRWNAGGRLSVFHGYGTRCSRGRQLLPAQGRPGSCAEAELRIGFRARLSGRTSQKSMFSPPSRTAFFIAALMLAAGGASIAARPSVKLADERPAISLENMVPRQFGEWRTAPLGYVQVVSPQTQELLDKLYSEILTRTYVNASGYRIMLSLAYGSDQRGSLQAHKPEVCYPAQGFVLVKNEAGTLATAFGEIPVRRLFTTQGARQEPLTYWFTVGDKAIQGKVQKRIVELSFGLTGRIPDGMLFRVSSIDPDQSRAYQLQEQFVNQLLLTVSPAGRKRLSGLGDS